MITIQFDSVSQRKTIHQLIRETAKEISSNTNILQILYTLENGNGRQDGFGYVEKNRPDSDTVVFYMSRESFEDYLDALSSTTINDLDNTDECYEGQLNAIIEQLHDASNTMREKMI